MRTFCLECVYKHIAAAAVAAAEMGCGYPQFLIYVIGNLDHAAQEAAGGHKELADLLRAHRLRLWDDPTHSVPYESLCEYVMVCAACGDDAEWPEIPVTCAVSGARIDAISAKATSAAPAE